MLHTLNSIPMSTTLSTPSTPTKNTKYTNSLFCHKEIFVANSRTFCDTFYVPKYCGGYQKSQVVLVLTKWDNFIQKKS